MNEKKKGNKSLIVGVVAAVAILAVVLVLLLTQCIGGEGTAPAVTSAPTQSTEQVMERCDLYWNLDRAEYDGKSEAGMSSRTAEADGYYHIRFILDGEEVTLKVADRRLVNTIDTMDIMGLRFDEDGFVSDVLDLDELPLEKTGWEFFVQSTGGGLIKLNSSKTFNGMELLLQTDENTGIYDMSGESGPVGCEADPIRMDRVYAFTNQEGILTHVFLYSRPYFMQEHEGECQHCKKTVTWKEWKNNNTLPTETGHYQLYTDIVVTSQQQIQEDQQVCLDLNGHLVTNKETTSNYYRIYGTFNAGTSLALMDTSEEKTGTIKAVGLGDKGLCVWARYGEFYMYGGTLDASEGQSNYPGTALAVESTAYAYMYGGEIIGGLSKYLYNAETKTYSRGSAGAVYVVGKFVMHDGVIRDGRAEAVVTAWNADGSPKSYQRGPGGNIFINTGGVMVMNGGTIKNGAAGTSGGNIFVNGGAELTINGGIISGGRTTGKGQNGGNLFVASNAVVNMNGGTIRNGTTYNYGGNVYVNGTFKMTDGMITDGRRYDWNTKKLVDNHTARNVYSVQGDFYMYGGRVAGGFHCIDTDASKDETILVVSARAVIFDEDGSGPHLTLSNTAAGGICTVMVGQMHDEGKIGISAVQNALFTKPTKENNTDNFVSDIEGAEILWSEDGLVIGRMQCVCGGKAVGIGDHKCEKVLFAPWVSATSLPTITGNYFLTSDVSLKTHTEYTRAADVNIDMNGKNITMNATENWHRVFRAYGTADYKVTIGLTNSKTVGGVVKTNSTVNVGYGMLVWLTQKSQTFNLYDGILDASSLTGVNGGVAVKLANGTFNMYGGQIKGGYDNNANTNSAVRGGGSVTVEKNGCFNMYGGTISDGGTVSNGGNFMLKGTLNVYGGSITGGRADNVGGNIMLEKDARLNVSGGEIYGGYKGPDSSKNYTTRFANVYSYGGNVTLSGGKVSGLAFYKGDATAPRLVLSGNAVIDTYKGGIGLALSSAVAEIDDSEGEFTGLVAMTTTGYVTAPTKEKYTKNFTSLTADANVLYHDSRILVGTFKYMCVCGGKAVGMGNHTCKDVLWTAWTSENSLPTTTGNYYLTKSVTLNGSAVFNTAATVNIDLAGFDITGTGGKDDRIFKVYKDGTDYAVTIGVTDSVGGGIIKRTHTVETVGYGSVVWLSNASHTFNLYAGILDGTAVKAGSGGAVVKMASGSQFNMYGGEIKGGTAQDRDAGAVMIDANAEFNLFNGTVTGGKTTGSTRNGGNFVVNGTLNLKGGTVSNGYAANQGGNIYVSGTGTLNLSGGSVENGYCGSVGGNIQVWNSGKLNISDGEIKGGYKWDGSSKNYTTRFANVYSYGGKVTLSGGKVSGIAVYKGDVNTSGLTLSGNPTVDAYNGGIGLALSGIVSTVDDSKGSFSGTVAMTTTGQITTKTEESYLSCFTSLTSGKSPVYKADGCIWID